MRYEAQPGTLTHELRSSPADALANPQKATWDYGIPAHH